MGRSIRKVEKTVLKEVFHSKKEKNSRITQEREMLKQTAIKTQ